MSSDINLYTEHPEKYSELQNLRPDYRGAIETTVALVTKYLKDRNKISVADFCGGIGNVTRKIAEHIPISKATIIDINKEFLHIAESSSIKTEKLETIHSDILEVKLEKEFDLVLSIFAYHHVTDNKKEKYLKVALSGLKENGFLVLTEIYSPNQDLTNQYYRKLLEKQILIPRA
ncbi:methyltransferase domain-containing protein [Candidatus Falkowbacteria bacterium]|nr:methyltransferase domain-containing protein [Candidatus Falkowbacteria bacterium]